MLALPRLREKAFAVYEIPVPAVVVAELNFEKKAEVSPPNTLAEAVSSVVLPAE